MLVSVNFHAILFFFIDSSCKRATNFQDTRRTGQGDGGATAKRGERKKSERQEERSAEQEQFAAAAEFVRTHVKHVKYKTSLWWSSDRCFFYF